MPAHPPAVDPFAVPGYRRTIVVTPHADHATAVLEDDYHGMAIALQHDGAAIVSVTSEMPRAPWTTCPGAIEVIARTFAGVRLDEATRRGEKRENCTPLYDLVLLAAAHAHDPAATVYTIAASDPIDGQVHAEIRRNGTPVLALVHSGDVLSAPPEAVGRSLFDLRDWIAAMPDPAEREAGRLLQWGTIIAHGRLLTMEQHSQVRATPAACYTFQAPRSGQAVRQVETIRDFSR